jgi:hypothetical protein
MTRIPRKLRLMMDAEIKAKKEIIRARIRAAMKNWKLPGVLAGTYAVMFGVTYLLFVGIGPILREPQEVQSFLGGLAGKLAFGTANICVGFLVAMFVLIYVLCPVTGPFALKLREPKKG